MLGRTEGFALRNGPALSVLNGLGNGLGYSLILVSLATVGTWGSGKLFGFEILKPLSDGGFFRTNGFMLLPPSAFFLIALIIWAVRTVKKTRWKMMAEHYLSLFVKSVFIENMALAFFFGHVHLSRGLAQGLNRDWPGCRGGAGAAHHGARE